MSPVNREDLELYVMGLYDGDTAALERAIAGDPAAQAMLADEAGLESVLRDAAAGAAFCPACHDLVPGARCEACGAALRPGGYTVERLLVENAHGRMYVARDADGTQVALKELAFVQSPGLEVVAAFEREAKFLRALEHPAIPRFRASFQEGTGVATRYYLAQDLVDGEALDARLDEHFFTEAEIIGIARQVLDVLVYLQGLSPMVIHRDIKPANLLVRKDGTIAVVDFGAAYVQGSTVGSTTIGTFGYMPIEQLAGQVDATTDGYALGASLMHLLTRQEPWRLLQGTVLEGLNVSRATRGFLGKLIALDPRARFRSAVEARAAIDRLDGSRPRRAPIGGRSLAVRERRGRMPAWAMAVVAMALATSAGAFGSWRVTRRHDRQRAEAARELAEDARARAEDAMHEAGRKMRRLDLDVLVRDLDGLARDACQCLDRRCADDVSTRLSRWSAGWGELRFDTFNEFAAASHDAFKRIGDLSNHLSACLTRLYTVDAMDDLRLIHRAPEGPELPVPAPTPVAPPAPAPAVPAPPTRAPSPLPPHPPMRPGAPRLGDRVPDATGHPVP